MFRVYQKHHLYLKPSVFNVLFLQTFEHNFLLKSIFIGQRLEYAADLYGNRESFIFSQTGDRLTFKSLKEKAEDFAAGLTAIGFEKGDRLGIWAPNCLEWIITQYATALIGVIQVCSDMNIMY